MQIFKYLLLLFLLSQPCVVNANKNIYQYKVDNNYLEVFGYKLATNHLPSSNAGHYVEFSESPNANYVIILSYIHLQGKYDAWLYDKHKRSKPLHINATHVGRHPEIKWYSNEIFSIAWGGMGYYTSGIYSVSDVQNGFVIDDPVFIDSNKLIYIAYVEDVLEAGIIIGKLFETKNKQETFYFDLPASASVLDRYESIKDIQIIGDRINIKYLKNGREYEYNFQPEILKATSNK